MKGSTFLLVLLLIAPALCFAKADGAWLNKVPKSDSDRVNPYSGSPDAIAAGRNLFLNNCAKCHGENATGKSSRPSLRSQRIQQATDGDLAWLLKNGVIYKGMPSWSGLPEQERWQIVSYLRSLNAGSAEVTR